MFPVVQTIDRVKDMMQRLSQLHHHRSATEGIDIRRLLLDIQLSVMKRGDAALMAYTRQFDRVADPDFTLCVTQDDIAQAYQQVSDDVVSALRRAADNIRAYHQHQSVEPSQLNGWASSDSLQS